MAKTLYISSHWQGASKFQPHTRADYGLLSDELLDEEVWP